MKLTFSPPDDNLVHTYCTSCQAEAVTVQRRAVDGKMYCCAKCGHRDNRAIIIDPDVAWWLEEGIHYHSTAGMFLRNPKGKFLFFRRVNFPFGLTVPAGHIGPMEDDMQAALRETFEETSIRAPRARRVGSVMVHQDQCPRGADSHLWQLFTSELPSDATVRINPDEGKDPVWLSPEEALRRPLTNAVRYIIKNFGHTLA